MKCCIFEVVIMTSLLFVSGQNVMKSGLMKCQNSLASKQRYILKVWFFDCEVFIHCSVIDETVERLFCEL